MAAVSQYSRDGHTVVHGDFLAVIDDIVEDGSVSLVFADPPYNIGKQFAEFQDRWESDDAYAAWCRQWIDLCVRKLRPNGAFYVMTSTQAMPHLDLYLRKRMTILSRIIWHYDSSGVQAKNFFGSLYEPILYAVKDPRNYIFNADAIAVEAKTGAVRKLIDYRKAQPTPYNSKKVPGNVWSIPRVRYRMDEYEQHPSQKPESLLERMILASTNPGDLVLDPFAGTFTAGAVARRLERTSISVELQKEYIKIGVRRLGIAGEIDGEPLLKLEKNYARKQGKSDSDVDADPYTLNLFGEEL
ncbi:MAG: adenine-specific DNA-methyltransferase [Chloroflexota bacterium]|nr:adenine-specific DNA-methyltransferase [Chloroflexota bacterium]